MLGAQEELWRELRAQGAQLVAAPRAAPARLRYLEVVREPTSAAKKPLGLVWVLTPSYSITTEGLKKVLEGQADVRIGRECSAGSLSCVVLYACGMEEGCLEGMGGIRELYPGVPLLVVGSHLDLALAWGALKNGADGGWCTRRWTPHTGASRSGSRPEGRACRPQAAARVLPPEQPEREAHDRAALGPSTREILEMLVVGLRATPR